MNHNSYINSNEGKSQTWSNQIYSMLLLAQQPAWGDCHWPRLLRLPLHALSLGRLSLAQTPQTATSCSITGETVTGPDSSDCHFMLYHWGDCHWPRLLRLPLHALSLGRLSLAQTPQTATSCSITGETVTGPDSSDCHFMLLYHWGDCHWPRLLRLPLHATLSLGRLSLAQTPQTATSCYSITGETVTGPDSSDCHFMLLYHWGDCHWPRLLRLPLHATLSLGRLSLAQTPQTATSCYSITGETVTGPDSSDCHFMLLYHWGDCHWPRLLRLPLHATLSLGRLSLAQTPQTATSCSITGETVTGPDSSDCHFMLYHWGDCHWPRLLRLPLHALSLGRLSLAQTPQTATSCSITGETVTGPDSSDCHFMLYHWGDCHWPRLLRLPLHALSLGRLSLAQTPQTATSCSITDRLYH